MLPAAAPNAPSNPAPSCGITAVSASDRMVRNGFFDPPPPIGTARIVSTVPAFGRKCGQFSRGI